MALDATADLIPLAAEAALGDSQLGARILSEASELNFGSDRPPIVRKTGRISVFGGANDVGVAADEGLALYDPTDVASNQDLFLPQQPPGTTGTARRLNPDASYLSCRWDYSVTPKDYLRSIRVKVLNPANSKSAHARPMDWGPAESTGRVADLSPALARALGLGTDDTCTIEIPLPATRVFSGPRLADVLTQAFKHQAVRSTLTSFGAAGRRGAAIDTDLRNVLPPHERSPDPNQMINAMNRLFYSNFGVRALNAIGDEERTLVALQRLSVEIVATSLRNTRQAQEADRLLVAPAKNGRPPTLMLMSREVERVEASRVISDEVELPLPILLNGALETADLNEETPEAVALREVLQGGESAVAELFLITQPEIVRTRQPRMVPLCAPTPHVAIQSGAKLSTVGVFCHDADGELGITACYHGTGPTGTLVTINERRYQVKRDSTVQDIVFIPLYRGFNLPPVRGSAGLLTGREPAKADHVKFDGAANQNRSTRIFGTDAGLLRARPTIMLKLQTDPDTDEGDSGCALIDESDRVLGFAFERTAYDDYPQFTDWIWAANALRALQLTPVSRGVPLMGWLNSVIANIAGVTPTDWTLIPTLPDPGLGIAGRAINPDQCYVELYVESLRLEKARRFATTFHGVIYSLVSLARNGTNRAELASVTKPQNLAALDTQNLDRVITVSKRIMAAMPWRGDPFGLELALFSVKSGNLLTPLINFVTKVSDKAGISTATMINPFIPLITDGLDMIAGQKDDTVIELAVDTDLALTQSQLCALIALPKNTVDPSSLSIDKLDRKLLEHGEPLQAAYCVFSIRSTDRNADWGSISGLQQAYADFTGAILSGRRKEAEEALAGFNRQLIVCPDLISSDKSRLRQAAREDLVGAFPGGGQAATPEVRRRFESRRLSDLRLYDD
jgi:hypothetical protein